MTRSRRNLFALAALIACAGAIQADGPTADQVQGLLKKYQDERAVAIEKKFPASTLERADEQAKRAEGALKAGNLADAARFVRDARWIVPYVPSELPAHVDRVLGVARMRHGDEVNAVAFSPDGQLVAAASKDASVKIWDLGNGRVVRTYRGSNATVPTVAWSKDGKWIASPADTEIHVWDAETGKLKTALKGHTKAVTSVAFRPDGKALVSGGLDDSVRIWDLDTAKQLTNLLPEPKKASERHVRSVTYSPNGALVAAVNSSGLLQIWNPALEPKKQLIQGFGAHPTGSGNQVIFGRDTSVLYTCGSDAKAKHWVGVGPDGKDLPGTGRPTVIDGHGSSVAGIALTADGKYLATACSDQTVRLWDLSAGTARLAREYRGHTDEVLTVAFSPDGQTLVSGSKDQSLRVWRVSLADDHRNLGDHTAYVWTAAFSPDGKRMADAGADRLVFIREPGGKLLHKLEGHTAPVTALAFSADSAKLATVGGDKVVRLWDAATGQKLKEWSGHTGPIMAVAFGGNNLLITGGIDRIARLWDVTKDQAVQTFPANKTAISALALRPDGKQALVGSADGMMRGYDLTATPKETFAVPAHLAGIGDIDFAPDSTRAASCGGDGLVKQWNLATTPPAVVAEVKADAKGSNKPLSSLSFNSDGRLVAVGGGDTLVHVWELATKSERRALRGHRDWVSAVSFAPDGRTVLSASVDKTVKVWELSSEEASKPIGHSRRLTCITVSGDGKWIASGSQDRTIKVWDTESAAEVFTLDAAAGGHGEDITSLAFDSSGSKLISGGRDHRLVIWDVPGRKPLLTMDLKELVAGFIHFGSKGDRFACWLSELSADSEVNFLKTYDPVGKPMNSLEVKGKVQCVAFSFDGLLAGVGFMDGSVQIWDLVKNERVGGNWPAFKQSLKDLAVMPDRKKLIAADVDGNIKVYDIAEKKVLKEFVAQASGLNGIMVAPSGSRFATMAMTGEVKLWNADTGELLRSWALPTPVETLAFSADGKKLITANADSTLCVLNLP